MRFMYIDRLGVEQAVDEVDECSTPGQTDKAAYHVSIVARYFAVEQELTIVSVAGPSSSFTHPTMPPLSESLLPEL